MTEPIICPRCGSTNTTYIESVETSICLDCDLDWWWSPDDGEVVYSE